MIVLVSGPPGSGKTTLARELAPKLRLPLIAKDDIKESLFDSLGWSDHEWSRKVGAAVWEVLFMIIGRAAETDASLIVESNFHADQRARIAKIGATFVEVFCFASPETLERRFRERDRHPGHADDQISLDGRELLDRHQPVVDRVIRVDTDHRDQVDVDEIIEKIREAGE